MLLFPRQAAEVGERFFGILAQQPGALRLLLRRQRGEILQQPVDRAGDRVDDHRIAPLGGHLLRVSETAAELVEPPQRRLGWIEGVVEIPFDSLLRREFRFCGGFGGAIPDDRAERRQNQQEQHCGENPEFFSAGFHRFIAFSG